MCHSALLLATWLVLLLPMTARSDSPSIRIYDLTYATSVDLNDANQVTMAWDHCHAVAALQGIVNREQPRLYVRFVQSPHLEQNVDDYWLEKFLQPGQWLEGHEIERVASIEELVEDLRDSFDGVVLYDPQVAATSNVASTIAGIENLLPVRLDQSPGSLYSRLVAGGPQLPVKRRLVGENGESMFTGRGLIPGTERQSTGSAKCDAYLWMKEKYLDTGLCDGAFGAYYLDQYWITQPRLSVVNHHCLTNHDFFISKRAFFFDLHVWGDETPIDDRDQEVGTDLETFKELLLSAYHHGGREQMIHIGGFVPWAYKYTNHGSAGGGHAPVASEWEYGKVISAYNGYMDADAIGYGCNGQCVFLCPLPTEGKISSAVGDARGSHEAWFSHGGREGRFSRARVCRVLRGRLRLCGLALSAGTRHLG